MDEKDKLVGLHGFGMDSFSIIRDPVVVFTNQSTFLCHADTGEIY